MVNPRRHRAYWDAALGQQMRVNLTPEEEAARDAEEAQFAIDRAEAQAVEALRLDQAASGRRKLQGIGLSESEINALMG